MFVHSTLRIPHDPFDMFGKGMNKLMNRNMAIFSKILTFSVQYLSSLISQSLTKQCYFDVPINKIICECVKDVSSK